MKTNETPISNTDIEKHSNNRFDTVIAGAMRARELRRGHLPLVDTKSVTHVVKALEEIAAGKINIKEYLDKLQKTKEKNVHQTRP
jgi:DNA-directed RNA polymerase omega subunit